MSTPEQAQEEQRQFAHAGESAGPDQACQGFLEQDWTGIEVIHGSVV